MSSLSQLLEQLTPVPPVETADLTGKTVMVIGANTGIGFEATKHFATMKPARLILACRSKEKGEAAIERIQKETGYKSAELWIVDLSVFSSVIAFADAIEKDGGRLDIVVANAGIASLTYSVTTDGYESTLQVNCLSLFLIAFRLLPQMLKTAKDFTSHPRLVFVTSVLHFNAEIPQRVLHGEETYKVLSSQQYCDNFKRISRYQESKLLDIFFYRAFSSHLGPASPLIVNGVHPGLCHSELTRERKGLKAFLLWLFLLLVAFTSEQGARQLIYAALGGESEDGEVEEKFRGAYVSAAQVKKPSDFVTGEEGKVVQEKLWKEVVDILGKVDPKVTQIVREYCVS